MPAQWGRSSLVDSAWAAAGGVTKSVPPFLHHRIAGLSKPLVGACAISLDVKMPWNAEGYVAPRSDLFDESAAFIKAEKIAAALAEAARKRDEAEDAEDRAAEEGGGDADNKGNGGGADNKGDDDDGEDSDDNNAADGGGGGGGGGQDELERRPGAEDAKDTGAGAFEAGVISDLPMVRHGDTRGDGRGPRRADDGGGGSVGVR